MGAIFSGRGAALPEADATYLMKQRVAFRLPTDNLHTETSAAQGLPDSHIQHVIRINLDLKSHTQPIEGPDMAFVSSWSQGLSLKFSCL